MTDETTNTDPTPFADPHDWFLQSLINMANNGVGLGVTLQVSGLLVSGFLASGKAYFDGFGEDLTNGFEDPEVAKSVRNSFAEYGEIYKEEDGNSLPPAQYIHLKDAQFFNTSGNPIPENKGVWWRGRLSEVAGFTLGTIGKYEK